MVAAGSDRGRRTAVHADRPDLAGRDARQRRGPGCLGRQPRRAIHIVPYHRARALAFKSPYCWCASIVQSRRRVSAGMALQVAGAEAGAPAATRAVRAGEQTLRESAAQPEPVAALAPYLAQVLPALQVPSNGCARRATRLLAGAGGDRHRARNAGDSRSITDPASTAARIGRVEQRSATGTASVSRDARFWNESGGCQAQSRRQPPWRHQLDRPHLRVYA